LEFQKASKRIAYKLIVLLGYYIQWAYKTPTSIQCGPKK